MANNPIAIQTSEQFGRLIRHTRKMKAITQKDLAAACGTGVRFVRELEAGKASSQLGKALRVAWMLGIPIYGNLPPEADLSTGLK